MKERHGGLGRWMKFYVFSLRLDRTGKLRRGRKEVGNHYERNVVRWVQGQNHLLCQRRFGFWSRMRLNKELVYRVAISVGVFFFCPFSLFRYVAFFFILYVLFLFLFLFSFLKPTLLRSHVLYLPSGDDE